jgi:hypothetical protein
MTTRSNAAAAARRGDAGPATRTAAGIGLIVLAILLFTVMDTLGKDLTGRYEAAFDPDSKKGGNANLPALSIQSSRRTR